MRLVPHESDYWDEFDLREALAKYLAERQMSGEDALCVLIEGLADNHRENRLAHAGQMPVTLLQGVELLLQQQAQKNYEIHEQQAGEDAPSDSDFSSGVIRGQRAMRQEAICDLLCECIKAVGAKPIRAAA